MSNNYTIEDVDKLLTDSLIAIFESRKKRPVDGIESPIVCFGDEDEAGTKGAGGLVASLQGVRAVFNGLFGLPGSWGKVFTVARRKALMTEWTKICIPSLLERDYHGAPYLNVTPLFGEGTKRSYTDTMSWGLSATSHLFHALTFGGFEEKNAKAFQKEYSDLLGGVREAVWCCLRDLLDAKHSKGGWSWGPKNEPDLYFTWTVLGGLNDFLDYVAGESAEEIDIPANDEMMAWLETKRLGIFEEIGEARNTARDYLAEHFLVPAKERALNTKNLSTDTVTVQVQNSLITIYHDMYLQEALLLSLYDKSGDILEHRKDLDLLHAVILDKASQARDKNFDDDVDMSTMVLRLKGPKMRKALEVSDGSLWPQLLRLQSLQSLYLDDQHNKINEFITAKESIGSLERIQSQRITEGEYVGLWDDLGFNLTISCRSIESLVDCRDYLDSFNRKMIERQAEVASATPAPVPMIDELAKQIAEAITPFLETPELETQEVSKKSGESSSIEGLTKESLAKSIDLLSNPALIEEDDDIGFAELYKLICDTNLSQNKLHMPLIKAIVFWSFRVQSKLFHYSLQEYFINLMNLDEDDKKKFRERNGDDLATRLKDGLKAIAATELKEIDKEAAKRRRYTDLFRGQL